MELGVIKVRTGQLRDVAAAAQAVREAVVPPPLTIVAVKEHLFEYMDRYLNPTYPSILRRYPWS